MHLSQVAHRCDSKWATKLKSESDLGVQAVDIVLLESSAAPCRAGFAGPGAVRLAMAVRCRLAAETGACAPGVERQRFGGVMRAGGSAAMPSQPHPSSGDSIVAHTGPRLGTGHGLGPSALQGGLGGGDFFGP